MNFDFMCIFFFKLLTQWLINMLVIYIKYKRLTFSKFSWCLITNDMEWHYDLKYGFKHKSLSLTSVATYKCHNKSVERESVAQYMLFIECKTFFDVMYIFYICLTAFGLENFFLLQNFFVWYLYWKNQNCIIFIFQNIENLYYDKRIGYTLRSPTIRDTGEYSCEANKNNISESRSFTVHVQSNCELVLLLTWCMVITY